MTGAEKQARYAKAHPDRIRAKNQTWHLAHPDYAAVKSKKWREDHPGKSRQYRQQRRARLREIPTESFNDIEIFERDGWICQLCNSPIDPTLRYPHRMSASLDHVIPLSHPGSSHTRGNVQASHLNCNQRKHTNLVS
jgi:5-methylcytosine-specific restriction endonuclease McrA